MFSLPQLHTKSLCVLALQNSQFEASTSSRPQTVNFEALGHKAIFVCYLYDVAAMIYVMGALNKHLYLYLSPSHSSKLVRRVPSVLPPLSIRPGVPSWLRQPLAVMFPPARHGAAVPVGVRSGRRRVSSDSDSTGDDILGIESARLVGRVAG